MPRLALYLLGRNIVATKKESVDKELLLAWNYLYEVEIIEDMLLEDILTRLNSVAKYIASVRSRKRITKKQLEKLTNLEKWYQSYDIKRLQHDIEHY